MSAGAAQETRDGSDGSIASSGQTAARSVSSPGGKALNPDDAGTLVEFRDVCKTYDGETLALQVLHVAPIRSAARSHLVELAAMHFALVCEDVAGVRIDGHLHRPGVRPAIPAHDLEGR